MVDDAMRDVGFNEAAPELLSYAGDKVFYVILRPSPASTRRRR